MCFACGGNAHLLRRFLSVESNFVEAGFVFLNNINLFMRHFRLSRYNFFNSLNFSLFLNIKTQPIFLNISQTEDQLYQDLCCVIYFLSDHECHIYNPTDSDLSFQEPQFSLLQINFCSIYDIPLNGGTANYCLPLTNGQNFNVSKLGRLKHQGRMRRLSWGVGTAG